ncbi:XPG N-terminal domain-containing protein [Toxoplasma gondii VAND]|uniref:XPG N-terminal domain-containing protein n=1 Tax=Toxoplasma gondii VAND TaxID=933077 RepID=A0A086QFI2_TOXGO|nr:XPG N-terminal domain-containing protein [Toxoplasma gondii VAND]
MEKAANKKKERYMEKAANKKKERYMEKAANKKKERYTEKAANKKKEMYMEKERSRFAGERGTPVRNINSTQAQLHPEIRVFEADCAEFALSCPKFLKPLAQPAHISEFAGQTVGVDAMSWLHRGAIACAVELIKQEESDKFLRFVIHMIMLFKYHRVEPLLGETQVALHPRCSSSLAIFSGSHRLAPMLLSTRKDV